MGFRIRNVNQLYTLPQTISAEFTYNFWVLALWDVAMGDQTLADVVARTFTGVSTALQAVKNGLSKAWDGIKSAGEFVMDTVIPLILNSVISVANLAINVIFSTASVMLGTNMFRINSSGSFFVLNGRELKLGVRSSGRGVGFQLGDVQIGITDILNPDIEVETLGISTELLPIPIGDLVSLVVMYIATKAFESKNYDLGFKLQQISFLSMLILHLSQYLIVKNMPQSTTVEKVKKMESYILLFLYNIIYSISSIVQFLAGPYMKKWDKYLKIVGTIITALTILFNIPYLIEIGKVMKHDFRFIVTGNTDVSIMMLAGLFIGKEFAQTITNGDKDIDDLLKKYTRFLPIDEKGNAKYPNKFRELREERAMQTQRGKIDTMNQIKKNAHSIFMMSLVLHLFGAIYSFSEYRRLEQGLAE